MRGLGSQFSPPETLHPSCCSWVILKKPLQCCTVTQHLGGHEYVVCIPNVSHSLSRWGLAEGEECVPSFSQSSQHSLRLSPLWSGNEFLSPVRLADPLSLSPKKNAPDCSCQERTLRSFTTASHADRNAPGILKRWSHILIKKDHAFTATFWP